MATKVLKKEFLNESVVRVVVDAPEIATKAKAGQFIILRLDEQGERIPLTIADYDKTSGSVTVIAQTVGYTTKRLGMLEQGDIIADFVGPLGKPSELDHIKSAAVVGGGVGCAIAYPQAKQLFLSGAKVDLIAGFRNKDIVILEDDMQAAATNFYLTTDDGSYKEKGFVTDKLRSLIESGKEYDEVIAIGPVPMMRAVCAVTKEFGIKTTVSLNPIMIDGTGMCGCCRVTVDGKVKFACVDGPDFDGHLVDFDGLMRRLRSYKQDEAQHMCRLTGEMR